jgi:uncharacterized SAM-binding protein YcdF (DUF218 family)
MRNILRLIALLLLIWLLGFIYFIYSIQTEVDEPKIKADAVVVLTGGSNRLAIGFEILNKKLAKRMFISGVANNVKIYELLNLYMQSPNHNNQYNIQLGKDAFNTISNAQETKAWIAKNNIKSIILVTANYHMPRSLFEFKRVIPEIAIIPHSVISDHVKVKDWWHNPGTAFLLFKEYNKYLILRMTNFL